MYPGDSPALTHLHCEIKVYYLIAQYIDFFQWLDGRLCNLQFSALTLCNPLVRQLGLPSQSSEGATIVSMLRLYWTRDTDVRDSNPWPVSPCNTKCYWERHLTCTCTVYLLTLVGTAPLKRLLVSHHTTPYLVSSQDKNSPFFQNV